MRHRTMGAAIISLLMAFALASHAWGQAAAVTARTVDDDLIVHLNLGNPTSLDEVLMVIQGMDPRFNYVLIRDPQVASDYATFPPMSVSNVTLKQIFDVIHAAFPMVDITTEDGPKTTLFLFNIRPDRLANNTTKPTSTTVYPLAETLDYLASRMPGKAPDESTNALLSAVQAALDESNVPKTYSLKIHPDTQLLIFTGVGESQNIVMQVLAALKPDTKDLYAQSQIELNKFRNAVQRLERVEGETQRLGAINEDLRRQVADLTRQLNALSPSASTTQPAKG